MKIRIEIEPNDLVRVAQKQQKVMSHDAAKHILRTNNEMIVRNMEELKNEILHNLIFNGAKHANASTTAH